MSEMLKLYVRGGFGERLAEDFNNEGDRYIYLQDCIIESPYGFK